MSGVTIWDVTATAETCEVGALGCTLDGRESDAQCIRPPRQHMVLLGRHRCVPCSAGSTLPVHVRVGADDAHRRASPGVFHSGVEVYNIEYAYGGECLPHCSPQQGGDTARGERGAAPDCTRPGSPDGFSPLQDTSTICQACLPQTPGMPPDQVGCYVCLPRREVVPSLESQHTAARFCCCAVVWRESIVIGETDMDPQEVQEVVQQLGSAYRGNAYHLLERNCNHFSDELCHKLTGHHAPLWVCPSICQGNIASCMHLACRR